MASQATEVVVTFRVSDGQEFRVRLTDPADIAVAQLLLAGQAAPGIPNGRIVRGSSDVNSGHDWYIDPLDFEFADVTTEVCDGLPSDVDKPSFSSDRYCPWTAKVTDVRPAP